MNNHNSVFRGGTVKTPQEELPEPLGSFARPLCAHIRPDPPGRRGNAVRRRIYWDQTGIKPGSTHFGAADPQELGFWPCHSPGVALGTGSCGSLAVTSSSPSPTRGFKAESSTIRVSLIPPRCRGGEEEWSKVHRGEFHVGQAAPGGLRAQRYASGWPLLVFLSSFLRSWDMK